MVNKLELNRKAIGRFLKGREVAAAVERVAAPVQQNAKSNAEAVTKRGEAPEVELKSFIGRDRARVHVAMTNPAAIRAEQVHRALTRAKHAGGGGQ